VKDGNAICYICSLDFPAALAHIHHIVPRSAAGSDDPGNKAVLCPNCHNAVDRCAILLSKGRIDKTRSLVEQYLIKDLASQKRLLDLANIQTRSWKLGNKPATKKIIIEIPSQQFNQLKGWANSRKNPNTGRPLGVTPFLTQIIEDYFDALVFKGQVSQNKKLVETTKIVAPWTLKKF